MARWDQDEERWVSSPSSVEDDGVEVMAEYLAWPLLRGCTYVGDKSPTERMGEAIKDLWIPQEVASTLFGPNLPSWMEGETDAEGIEYGNTVVEVTHPSWTQLEFIYDSAGNSLDPVTGDPQDAATYQLMFFDSHGKAVFNLEIFDDDRAGQETGASCHDPAATYTLLGLSPTSVVADEGELALGLITEREHSGIVRSSVSLVRADSTASGKLCDLPTTFHLNGKLLQSDAWSGYLGFENEQEQAAYLQSSEYQRAVEVAASLKLR